jgi:hypothetical protein
VCLEETVDLVASFEAEQSPQIGLGEVAVLLFLGNQRGAG